MPLAQLLQHADHTLAGQSEIALDRQDVTCTIVDDIEGTVGAAIDQHVTHEVHGPDLVGVQLLYQRLLHAFRQSTAQGQAMLAIQPLRAFVVDSVAFPPKLLMQLMAALGTMDIRQLDQPRFNGTVLPASLHDPTLCAARLFHQSTRAALAEPACRSSPMPPLRGAARVSEFFVRASFNTA